MLISDVLRIKGPDVVKIYDTDSIELAVRRLAEHRHRASLSLSGGPARRGRCAGLYYIGRSVQTLHLFGEDHGLVVEDCARIKGVVRHHAMDLATLHADIAGVIDREAQRLPHVLLQGMALVVAVYAHDPHARVDHIDAGLTAKDFRPGAWNMALAVVKIEILCCLPREVARRPIVRR